MSQPTWDGRERRSHPRRRVEDWRDTSSTKLSTTAFRGLVMMLGYDPSTVLSVRVNPREAVVTIRMESGLPRSVRHELVDE